MLRRPTALLRSLWLLAALVEGSLEAAAHGLWPMGRLSGLWPEALTEAMASRDSGSTMTLRGL